MIAQRVFQAMCVQAEHVQTLAMLTSISHPLECVSHAMLPAINVAHHLQMTVANVMLAATFLKQAVYLLVLRDHLLIMLT